MVKKNGVFYFEKLLVFPQLVHGFSTRKFGNMRTSDVFSDASRLNFVKALGGAVNTLVRMHQVHGTEVGWVSEKDRGSIQARTDALLTDEKDVLLSVVTADCVPVLLYDFRRQVVGIVHAGWRGVYKKVLEETVAKMIAGGSDPKDIIAGIGPCIRVCCYEVDRERAEMFRNQFPWWKGFAVKRDGKVFLDLPFLVRYQLQSMGVRDENGEDGHICTAENLEDFYSYRKEGEKFGVFMGVIGMV